MVGLLGCGCCESGFCNYDSTTGSRIDEMNPPFGRKGLTPSDYPGSYTRNINDYKQYTIEGWSKWLDYGNTQPPWQRQQSRQFATPLDIIPPLNPAPTPYQALFRPRGGDKWNEPIQSQPSPRDVFFYSWDFKTFNYKVSADLYLPIAHAPQFNAVLVNQYTYWVPNGEVIQAYLGPELGFSGLFSECTETQARWPMGPIVFIFLRRELSGAYPWFTYGPWEHWFYIWDKSSPTIFFNIVPQRIPSAEKFTVEISTDLVNVSQINTSNQPVLQYTVRINGAQYYQQTYTLAERNASYSKWRAFCRCNVAASIWGNAHSQLLALTRYGSYPGTPYDVFYLRGAGWTYDPTEHFKIDRLVFEEIKR
jgi:hypothetical protein